MEVLNEKQRVKRVKELFGLPLPYNKSWRLMEDIVGPPDYMESDAGNEPAHEIVGPQGEVEYSEEADPAINL